MVDYQKYFTSAVVELKRGTLVLCVLSVLNEPLYGYSLLQVLAKKGYNIDQSTLYPLLRRLEQQGFLISKWSVEEARPRKYYELSEDGKTFLFDLKSEWHNNVKVVESLIN